MNFVGVDIQYVLVNTFIVYQQKGRDFPIQRYFHEIGGSPESHKTFMNLPHGG